MIIEDPADPRLADYIGLTDVARRLKHEPERGFFIAEGAQVVQRAAAAGYPLRTILLATNRQLPEGLPDAPVLQASHPVLEAATGFHVHRGVLASFGRIPLRDANELLATAERILVLEDVNNHTNLGAVFRSAAGLGMDAVLLSPRCCDPLYRRAIRVSMGEVFALPYAYLEPFPGGVQQVRDAGFRVLAMTPDGTDLGDVEIKGRTALLLGAEGPGLTEAAMSASDLRVGIPMSRGVDSLNIAAAAAVGCWAVARRPEAR
ncbi:MAG: hypothetical protein QOG99_1944 [Frankiales bacterium]|nr:hypothetical protein [Frankiales bacterium]